MLVWKVLGCWLGAALTALFAVVETEAYIPHALDWNTVFNGLTLVFTIAITVVGVLVRATVGDIKKDIDKLTDKQDSHEQTLASLREKVAGLTASIEHRRRSE